MKVVWSKEATDRLDEIEAYIAPENEKAAVKIILSLINKTMSQLTRYPASGKPGRLTGTRELFFSDSPFAIVYTVHKETINIITVFHTAQNFQADQD